jgi:predicted AAA+ superfamily ATPase
MGITEVSQLVNHPLRGMLYENSIVSEVMKYFLHRGQRRDLYFYRDSHGNEVDLVIPRGHEYIPVEIKAAQTISSDNFKGLKRFAKAIPNVADPVLVYGGDAVRQQAETHICGLSSLDAQLSRLFTLVA